jgi:proline racemase
VILPTRRVAEKEERAGAVEYSAPRRPAASPARKRRTSVNPQPRRVDRSEAGTSTLYVLYVIIAVLVIIVLLRILGVV